jgi:hypothetical protein
MMLSGELVAGLERPLAPESGVRLPREAATRRESTPRGRDERGVRADFENESRPEDALDVPGVLKPNSLEPAPPPAVGLDVSIIRSFPPDRRSSSVDDGRDDGLALPLPLPEPFLPPRRAASDPEPAPAAELERSYMSCFHGASESRSRFSRV